MYDQPEDESTMTQERAGPLLGSPEQKSVMMDVVELVQSKTPVSEEG